MNVYEEAHSLAKAIKESEEYKQYEQSKKLVEGNPQLSSLDQGSDEKADGDPGLTDDGKSDPA